MDVELAFQESARSHATVILDLVEEHVREVSIFNLSLLLLYLIFVISIVCRKDSMDLAIAIDSSGSMNKTHFRNSLEFVNDIM